MILFLLQDVHQFHLPTAPGATPFALVVDDERKKFEMGCLPIEAPMQLPSISIDRQTGALAVSPYAGAFKPDMDSVRTVPFYLCAGVLRMRKDSYLVLVTDAVAVASVIKKKIFGVTKVQLVCFSSPYKAEEQFKDERSSELSAAEPQRPPPLSK